MARSDYSANFEPSLSHHGRDDIAWYAFTGFVDGYYTIFQVLLAFLAVEGNFAFHGQGDEHAIAIWPLAGETVLAAASEIERAEDDAGLDK